MSSTPLTPWRWPHLKLRPMLGLLAGFLALGFWLGSTVALEMRAGGNPDPWTRPLLWELTGALATWAVLWIPVSVVLNAPRPGGDWRRFLGLHLTGWAIYTTLKNALMLASRFALSPWLGWGPYHYGDWPTHLAMEAMKDVLAYGLLAMGYQTLRVWGERQEEQVRQARLEAELHDAQLRQLTGQLDPHFLFNALNTVSSVMYEDLGRTDALLTDLRQLLRAGLARRGPTWTLAEEGDHLHRYDTLLLARFQDRLKV